MKKNDLQNLGRSLRESASVSSRFKIAIDKVREDIKALDVLLKEANRLGLIDLSEEAIEVESAENVWKASKDSAKTYISNTAYFVKQLKDDSEFEVMIDTAGKRKFFAKLSNIDLKKSFTPMRPNQTPDVEGYVQYRDIEQVEAFAYSEDTVKLNTDALLNKGDYLVRKIDGNDFIYEVQKARDFEASYSEK